MNNVSFAITQQFNVHQDSMCSAARGESIHGPSAATSLWRTASNTLNLIELKRCIFAPIVFSVNGFHKLAQSHWQQDAATEPTGMYLRRAEAVNYVNLLDKMVGEKYEH